MLLPQTLQSLQTLPKDRMQDTLHGALYSEGVSITLLDVIFGHYFIYAILSDGILAPVFLYQHSISYKQSQICGLPKVHFCVCNEIRENFSPLNKTHTLHHLHYIAKISKKNAFNVSIKQGGSEVGLYNDYPLELCAMCSDILKQMQPPQDMLSKYSTFNDYVFSHQWLHLLESPSRQNELTSLQNANLTCYKCKKPITLDTPIWLHIHADMLKIYCC